MIPIATLNNRQQTLEQIRTRAQRAEPWDVVVIGGGATGVALALDAVTRGLQVLLLESHDFGKGTSSRSSKLIHGGLRYLAMGQLAMVRESLAEREVLLRTASHWVKPLPMILPVHRWRQLPYYWAGLALYDWMGGQRGLSHPATPPFLKTKRRWLSTSLCSRWSPSLKLEKLKAGLCFFDAQFDDTRLLWQWLHTGMQHGLTALNYAPVVDLGHDDKRLTSVVMQDAFSGETIDVPAKVVINATGVWSDGIRRRDRTQESSSLLISQGIHLVVDSRFLPSECAICWPRPDGKRVLFVLPWQGKTLIGTTDTPRAEAALEPIATDQEIQDLLDAAAMVLDPAPTLADVRSVFVGLRPLVQPPPSAAARDGASHQATSTISREDHIDIADSGLVSLLGGKWTTARAMAERALDLALAHHGIQARPCMTRDLTLSNQPEPEMTTASVAAALDGSGAPMWLIERWFAMHGRQAALVGLLPGARAMLHPAFDLTEAQVRFFVRYEMAQTVEDVLARRHRALFLDARAASQLAPLVAVILAEELGHDEAWQANQCRQFAALAQHYWRGSA